MLKAAEARHHPRAQAKVKVEYHFGSSTGIGYTDDISEGGMLLSCEAIAQPGTRIYLRMHLPGSQAGEPLKIIGVVRRIVDQTSERAAMGIHFEVAYARTREALSAFIEQLTAMDQACRPRASSSGRHGIVALEGSSGHKAEYAMRFSDENDSTHKPLDAARVQKAFAFKAPNKQIGDVDWGRIGRFVLGLFALGLLVVVIFFVIQSVGGVFR